MTDNIFHAMREQMTPSAEATERLKTAVEAEPSGLYRDGEQHEEGSGGREATAQHAAAAAAIVSPSPFVPFEATAATGKGTAKRRRFFTLYLSAAAAFFLVLIASGMLIANLSSFDPSAPPPRTFVAGVGHTSVMGTGDVRAPANYQELYRILDEELKATQYYGYTIFDSGGVAVDSAAGAAETAAAPGSAVEDTSRSSAVSDGEFATLSGSETSVYSETNVQVSGIDEGDIIKTDGTYIYTLSRFSYFSYEVGGGELVIFKANGADTAEIVRTQIASSDDDSVVFYPQELYVSGSVLVIITDVRYNVPVDSPISSEGALPNNETRVIFYDISDPESPEPITEFNQSGNFSSSRLYGDTLYLISSYYLYGDISDDDPGSFVPLLGEGDARACMAVEDIRLMPEVRQPSYTVVTSYDLAAQTRIDQKSVLGEASTVYMSYANLYLGSSIFISEVGEPYQESVYTIEEHTENYSTQIVRIGINEGSLDAAAQCVVSGMLLNQFSLDEYEGNLRLVVTIDDYGYRILRDESQGVESIQYNDDRAASNALYVLDPSLNIIGSITGMAQDEHIYSARFTGPVGYMVTYRQMDPLFAIDLSDPTAPRVTSELKIPGFSTYLHPFGEGRLLGFGYDAEGAMRDGMKLSMFDISNPFDVTESFAQSVNIYDSEALHNHKAVLVDAERNIIGFSGSDKNDGAFCYFVYRYDDAQGFTLRGQLPLSSSYQDYGIRGIFINDHLYVLGEYLDVFDLETLGHVRSIEMQ
jgi:uncharacterized secreted protein with C-terminal beta-propeller domain